MNTRFIAFIIGFVAIGSAIVVNDATSRKPIRNAFFNVYPTATGTKLDDLPSDAGHCGVCHYDFSGSGPRNAYGLAVEVARGIYSTDELAIQSLDSLDTDNDGFINNVEITDVLNFSNTPTFPGLTVSDTGLVINIPVAEIVAYLTPSGGTDTIPPAVAVLTPNGAETFDAGTTQSVTWSASDASGIALLNVYLSDDGGTTFKPVAINESNDGTFDWFVPNLPGVQQIVRVEARDGAGNFNSDDSDAFFTINSLTGGFAPTTLRDMELAGSQPLTGTALDDPDVTCVTCHGQYDSAVEPWYQWKGSMMAQAMRDPLFLACLAIAEQDAPSVGDLCLRCHTPGGWLEGRSVDTDGGMLTAKDRQGVQCDFCHRLVDYDYQMGVSPPNDQAVLDSLSALPLSYANGQFITDPNPIRRGPYPDAAASHSFLESPFHREADLCGTCHDVSNPVFVAGGSPGEYNLDPLDTPHVDGDLRNMFPIERTFSEWSQSEYAASGVFAPQFAGDLPSGIVSTCQDCHMRDVTGKGCNEPGAPNRSDLPLHDLTGGNYFIPDIIDDFFPGEVDTTRLAAGKQRAIAMLQLAATMAVAPEQVGNRPQVTVTVTNETGHKLPSGYPEGRRIWLNLKAYDTNNTLVYESGAYDAASGVLTHDTDAKIYEIKPGISTRLGPVVGLPSGESFHFVLNDTILSDNRIPPRGFTNANFTTIQSQPVAYAYADGEYWDETSYLLPEDAVFVETALYYQNTTKEYVEFLRDENTTNSAGQDLYNAWVAHGRAAPVTMAYDTMTVLLDPTDVGDQPLARTELWQNFPNPFNPATTVRYSLADRGQVRIAVYDAAGHLVRTLVDDVRPAGIQRATWYGYNDNGDRVASGVYFVRMTTATERFVKKAVLLK